MNALIRIPDLSPKGDLNKKTRAVYSQNFRARFTKLTKNIETHDQDIKEDKISHKFDSLDDADFVLVVDKTSSESISSRFANRIARLRGREPITKETLAEARGNYIQDLTEKYKIDCKVFETKDRDYYVIQLSFYHLGLMMELLSYQWQLRSDVPEKKAFKTFFFIKRGVKRFMEYHLGEGSRDAFPSRWRYDLTYFFLMGAIVPMPYYNVWRNATKESLDVQREKWNNDFNKGSKGYSLTRLLEDGIFDDWLILHIPRRLERKPEVNAEVGRLKATSQHCVSCGAVCCFPCITCQCREAKRFDLDNQYPKRKGDSQLGRTLCSLWRSFWYNNLVGSVDLKPRQFPDGSIENTREYFGRIGTVRNALSMTTPLSDPDEKPAKFRHILPLTMLNDYFGEKIAFYFGWIELFLLSLIVPAIIGVIMFLVGVVYYAFDSSHDMLGDAVVYSMAKACDNYATPVFAGIMIIWGTTFYELWNRRQRWYSFLWRVENLQKTELERPPLYSFKFAAKLRSSPFGAPLFFVPSAVVTFFFIVLVFVSVYFINILNVYSIPYCPKPEHWVTDSNSTSAEDGDVVNRVICTAMATGQVLLNSISQFVLDLIYTRICYWLTDFEGHSTQSDYADALIFKLFTFRFFNYYTVLFYISFGIATGAAKYPSEITGNKYYDYEGYACGQQPCMALLSRQLLSLIVTQPFLNSLLDVLLPLLKYVYYSVKDSTKLKRKINPNDVPSATPNEDGEDNELLQEIEKQYRLMELSSLDRKEFTAEEFTDKIIVYGALVMFSVALPPAPALAMIILRVDLNLDLGRVMTKFRRPLPTRAHDIGMWANAINFLTYMGIITNPLIVILTSSWGSRFDVSSKFVIFLVVEHVIFAVRMLITFIVPDVPKSLLNQQQLHKMIKDEVQNYRSSDNTEETNQGTTKKSD